MFDKPSMLAALGARAIREADRDPSQESNVERAKFLSLYVEKMRQLVETIAKLDHLYFYEGDRNCDKLYECMNKVSDSENTLQSLEQCAAEDVTKDCQLTGGVGSAIGSIRTQIKNMRKTEVAGRSVFQEYAEASTSRSDDMMADAVADVAEKHIKDLREELYQLQAQLQTTSDTHKEHATKVDQIKTQVTQKQDTINKLEKDLQDCNVKLKDAERTQVELRQLREKERQDQVNMRKEIAKLQAALDAQMQDMKSKLEGAQAERKQMEVQIADLTADRKPLQDALAAQIDEAVKIDNKHNAQIEGMNSKLAQAQATHDKLTKEKTDLARKHAMLRDNCNSMESKLAQAQAQLQQLREKEGQDARVQQNGMREEMKAQIAKQQQLHEKEMKEKQNTIDSSKGRHDELTEEINLARDQAALHKEQMEGMESKLAQAQAELQQLRDAYDIELKEGRQCIQRLRGIAYPDSQVVVEERCPKEAPHHCRNWTTKAKCIPRPGYNLDGHKKGEAPWVAPCEGKTRPQWENDMIKLKLNPDVVKMCGSEHKGDSCGKNSVMHSDIKRAFEERHGEALAPLNRLRSGR